MNPRGNMRFIEVQEIHAQTCSVTKDDLKRFSLLLTSNIMKFFTTFFFNFLQK
jgi:hypothetical protein